MNEAPAGRASRGTGERGSAAVEFALVLPLVLLMALALLQVGLLVKDRLILEDAARAGAREAAVDTDDGQVRSSVVQAAVGLDPDALEVVVDRQGGSGSPVTVRLTYHDGVAIPLVAWLFPDPIDLGAEITMRQEVGSG
jgi:Flp pilus assembly protein TadG